jgi:hypothetical protein
MADKSDVIARGGVASPTPPNAIGAALLSAIRPKSGDVCLMSENPCHVPDARLLSMRRT